MPASAGRRRTEMSEHEFEPLEPAMIPPSREVRSEALLTFEGILIVRVRAEDKEEAASELESLAEEVHAKLRPFGGSCDYGAKIEEGGE
jgi:hypothetical protein